MAGELASAVIVIVERWQIVVNQRIGVDELQRAGGGDGAVDSIGHSVGGCQAEQRADALASGEQAVAHCTMDGRGRNRFGWDKAIQLAVDELLLLVQVIAEVHPFSGRNGSAWTLPSFLISNSMRVSASSSCLRQDSLRAMPFSNSSS